MVLTLSEIGISVEQDGQRLSMNHYLELEWLL
jgi:hypothetical protein